MSEIRCVAGFEIAEFFQEPRDLENYTESVFGTGLIVHIEVFYSFIVFGDRVKSLLLKLLPKSAEFVFVVGIEQQQEVFDARDGFF